MMVRRFIPGSFRRQLLAFATVTHAVNLIAMVISLWMAFYLFARGFPNRITLRAVLALLAIAVFFLGTYNHFHNPDANTAGLRAALLVIALACWYSTTFALLTPDKKARLHWMEVVIYALGIVSVILLVTEQNVGFREREGTLYTAKLSSSPVNILYGITQLTAFTGVIFNLMAGQRLRTTHEGKYLILASLFLIAALAYGILSLTVDASFPRVYEDGFVFGGIFLLGLSVARHQSLVERRTIWQDFPISMLGMFGIVSLYIAVCYWFEVPNSLFGNIAALVITSHSMYDLGREAVERWRRLEEKRFKRNLLTSRNLTGEEALRSYLDDELGMLLETLNTPAGLIAVRLGGKFVVAAARGGSLPASSDLPEFISSSNEGAFRLEGEIPGLVWGSQAFEGMEPVALVAVGASNTKLEYSSGDLELLDEFTEQIGTLVSISNSRIGGVQPAVDRVAESLALPPEADWVKMVDEGLRRFSDYVSLGQSALADWADARGESHIERGKQMQAILREAIQSLRPEGERPPEPLPREWYNHVVLHDAYIKGVPNREVMARLYVSEGTFHRIRRHAVRSVARYLVEKKKPAGKSEINSF